MNTEVLIIGAGPVGLTLALLLARHGVRVCVLEASSEPERRSRAIALDDEGLRIWQACGLEPHIAHAWAAGTPGSVMCRYQDARGRALLEIAAQQGDLGYPSGVVIDQPSITRTLWRHVHDQPGITFLANRRLRDLRQDSRGVAVQFFGPDDAVCEFRSPWVVACDGARSTAREIAGIAMPTLALPNPWLVADVADDKPDGYAKIICEPGRTAVTVPFPGGFRRIEILLQTQDPCDWIDDDRLVRSHLMRAWGGAATADIAQKSIVRFGAGIADRWRSGRLFLAGDAAHITPPFAGQGMATGLRDASNLAFKLAGVCRGWLDESVLDTYELERRPHQQRMSNLAMRLGRLMMPSDHAEAALVRLAVRATSALPPFASALRLRGPSLRPYYRDGFLIPGGAAGRYLPQPNVRSANGRQVRLDMLLGERMTWIITAGARQRRGCAPRNVAPGDTVLIEGRDFHDPSGLIRSMLGRGAAALVRPDRIIHTHIPKAAQQIRGGRKRRWIPDRSAHLAPARC